MGCTQRGVRIAETEQPYMSGNVGLPNKQMDLWVDVYISVKTGGFCTKVSSLCSFKIFSFIVTIEIDLSKNRCDRLRFRNQPPGLSLRLDQRDDLSGLEDSPGEEGMHTEGSEDPSERAELL